MIYGDLSTGELFDVGDVREGVEADEVVEDCVADCLGGIKVCVGGEGALGKAVPLI